MNIFKFCARIFLSVSAPVVLLCTLVGIVTILLPLYRQTFATIPQPYIEITNPDTVAASIVSYVLSGWSIAFYDFSVREQLHLVDIRNLVSNIEIIAFSMFVIMVCSGTFLFLHAPRVFYKTLYQSFLWSTVLSLGTAAIVILNFPGFFELFHQITFHNKFWQLDPTYEPLIVLFPPQLFYTLALIVLGGFIILSVILSTFCYRRSKIV